MWQRRCLAVVVGLQLFAAASGAGGGSPLQSRAGPLERTSVTGSWVKFAGNDAGNRVPEFAKKNGLNVEMHVISSGSDALTALIRGQVDFGICTYTYLFQGRDQGADVVAIATNITGGTAILTSNKLNVARGDYNGLKSLATQRAKSGQKLKLVSSTVSINYALGYLSLKKHGIDVDSLFALDDVRDFSLHPQLISSGAGDIAITGEPGAATIVDKKLGHLFAYPYDSLAGAINTEWCALRSFVSKYPNTAKATVKALLDTNRYLAVHSQEEIQDVVNFTGLNPTIARDALKDVHHETKMNVAGCDALANQLYLFKLVKNNYSGQCSSFVLNDLAK